LPFDVALVRAVGYQLKKGKLTKAAAQKLKSELAGRLHEAINGVATDDSPLFQLIPKFPGIDLPDEVTETFKDRIRQPKNFARCLFKRAAFCRDRCRCHDSIPIRLCRQLVPDQDCHRCFGRFRCRNRIRPWLAAIPGTLDCVSSHSGVAQKGEILVSDSNGAVR
jgi:hypothetical protein